MYTKEQVQARIEELKDPSNEKTLKETGGVKHIEIDEEAKEELKEVVNSVLKNISRTDQNEIQNYEDITLNIPSQEVVVIGERVHFTSSEFKIIHLLLKNTNRVLSREKILNHIAPGNFSANDRMIDTYISALRRKIKKFELNHC